MFSTKFYRITCSPFWGFLAILNIITPSFSLNHILVDVSENYTILQNMTLDFQISNPIPLRVGSFQITASCLDPNDCARLCINRQKCENQFMQHEEVSSGIAYTFPKRPSEIFFNANTSDNSCFSVANLKSTHSKSVNFSIMARFTPVEIVVSLRKPQTFKLTPGIKKEVALDLTERPAEIILITIKNKTETFSTISQNLNWDLSDLSRECLSSPISTSWVCHTKKKREIFKLIFYSSTDLGIYEIVLSKVEPERITSNVKELSKFSIPGHGTLFSTRLDMIGILKLKANLEDGTSLMITADTSLSLLFNTLVQQRYRKDDHLQVEPNERDSVIENKKNETEWFLFVQAKERETKYFWLSTTFVKLETISVGTQKRFYIDPEIYEYQHLKLYLDPTDFQRYKITLHALQTNSSMNLFYSTVDTLEVVFLDQDKIFQKVALEPVNTEYLYASLVAKTSCKVKYLAICALKKGFYTIQVAKDEPDFIIRGIYVILSFWSLGTLGLFIKFFFQHRSIKCEYLKELPRSSQIPEAFAARSAIELEINPTSSNLLQIEVNNCSSVKNKIPKRFNNMIEKLIRQQELDQMAGLKHENHYQNCGYQEKVIDEVGERERCDICYQERELLTFYPCAHRCVCTFCVIIIIQTSAICPLCRSNIASLK